MSVNPPPADPPAPIELLDQETRPLPPAARLSRWERWIGLALVLGLAAFGLAQWGTESTHQSAYRAGVRAEAGHDWDTAAAAYGQAGEYRDARAQATHAAAQARERDSAAQAAATAIAGQDWSALVAARDRLQKVVPDSPDVPRYSQLIFDQVYTPALSGTVALRPKATPPGWYTYRDGGWRWLQGSDTRSRIEARCPDGGWLLDVADHPGESVPASPVPDGADDYTRSRAGRRLAVVNADGSARTLLAPALATSGVHWCDARQVWNLQPIMNLPHPETTGPALNVFTATYQVFDQVQANTPHLPGPDWYIYPAGNDGKQIFVVDATGITATNSQTRLYLAAPDGSNLHALGVFDGSFSAGELDNEGRYGIISTNHVSPPNTTGSVEQTRRVYLLDTTGQRPTHVLAEVRVETGTETDSLELTAHIIRRSPYAGQILLTESREDSEQVSILEPTHPDRRKIVVLPHRVYEVYSPVVDQQGGILLAGARGPGAGSEVIFTYVDPHLQVHEFYPSSQPYEGQMPVIRKGRAVYMDGRVYASPSRETNTTNLFSLTLGRFGDEGVSPTPLYTGPRPFNDSNGSFPSAPWRIGPEFLLYVTPNGDVHARRYDGSGDLVIEHEVAGFAGVYMIPYDEP